MKNTGTKQAGTPFMAWRSTRRTELLSRPIIGHTPRKLPRLRAISRFIAVLCAGLAPPHSPFIIKENVPDVKRIFSVFYKIPKIFLATKNTNVCGGKTPSSVVSLRTSVLRQFSLPKTGRAHALPAGILLNKPHPSKYRWCTSCRTRGTRPRCRSGPAACSGS